MGPRASAKARRREYQFVSLNSETAETFYDAAGAPDLTAERLFDLRWATTLTTGALNSLRQELEGECKVKLFEHLSSFLTGGSVIPSYDEVSASTGLPRATVKTHVHRLRLRYREIVRGEIGRSATTLLLIYGSSLVAATAIARNWTGTLTQPVFMKP